MWPIRADWLTVLKPSDLGGGVSICVTLQLRSFVYKHCDLIRQIAVCPPYDRWHCCRAEIWHEKPFLFVKVTDTCTTKKSVFTHIILWHHTEWSLLQLRWQPHMCTCLSHQPVLWESVTLAHLRTKLIRRNSFSGLFPLFLSVFFFDLTWQDQNFVSGSHQLSIFVPGECWRGDCIRLTIERDGIVEYDVSNIPSKAWGRCSISKSTRPVEIRWNWIGEKKKEEKYLCASLSEHFQKLLSVKMIDLLIQRMLTLNVNGIIINAQPS